MLVFFLLCLATCFANACRPNKFIGMLDCTREGLTTFMPQHGSYDWVRVLDLRSNNLIKVDLVGLKAKMTNLIHIDLRGNPKLNCSILNSSLVEIYISLPARCYLATAPASPSKLHTSPLHSPSMSPTSPLHSSSKLPTSPLHSSSMSPTSPLHSSSKLPTSPLHSPSMSPTSPLHSSSKLPTSPLHPSSKLPTSPLLSPSKLPTSPLHPSSKLPILPLLSPSKLPTSPLHSSSRPSISTETPTTQSPYTSTYQKTQLLLVAIPIIVFLATIGGCVFCRCLRGRCYHPTPEVPTEAQPQCIELANFGSSDSSSQSDEDDALYHRGTQQREETVM